MAHRAPAWMENLVEVISECVEAQSPMGPLGYRSLAQGDPWELMVYPTPVELVGGADDGAVVIPGFSLDLQALLAYFDRVEAFQWYPSGLGPYDTEGPCVSIEGLYQGHDVWLRLLAGPPEDEEPGLQLASGSPPWKQRHRSWGTVWLLPISRHPEYAWYNSGASLSH